MDLSYKDNSYDITSKRKVHFGGFVDIIILLVLIRPHFSFMTGVLSVYLFDIVIVLMLLYKNKWMLIENRECMFLLAVLSAVLVIKVLFGMMDLGVWLDVVKFFYYGISFFLIRKCIDHDRYPKTNFERILKFGFYYNVIISSIQFFDVPLIRDVVHYVYGVEKLRAFWSGYPRVYGTFYNANWFGIYAVFMFGFFTYIFCQNNKLSQYIIQSVLSIYLLLLSASRTAMLSAIICFLIIVFMFKKIKKGFLLFAVVGILCITAIYIASHNELYYRTFMRYTTFFSDVKFTNGDISAVAGSRHETWMIALPLFLNSPIIGDEMGVMLPHNSYIAFLIEFGLLGVIGMLPIVYKIVNKIKKIRKYGDYKIFLIGFTFALLFVFLGGEYLFCSQIIMLEVILLAVVSQYNSKDAI